MTASNWISDNYIEVFGALTGVIYVFLEIRQKIWLWPVGIITSAVYIWVFFTSRFYADMSLQAYYLVISFIGWYWWVKGSRAHASAGSASRAKGTGFELIVTRLKRKPALILAAVFVFLYFAMWIVLSKLTDSPVPEWDSFITSLSVVATWMLARKIYEHWYLWIIVNLVSAVIFTARGLYPTVILYIVYCIMSFAGLAAWKKTIRKNL